MLPDDLEETESGTWIPDNDKELVESEDLPGAPVFDGALHCSECGNGVPADMLYTPGGKYHMQCYEAQSKRIVEQCKKDKEQRDAFRSTRAEAEAKAPVICNWCGQSCNLGHEDFNAPHGLVLAEVTGGYSSMALQDEHRYHFSLCEFCLDYLFCLFSVRVRTTLYSNESIPTEPWAPLLERIAHQENSHDLLAEHTARHHARNLGLAQRPVDIHQELHTWCKWPPKSEVPQVLKDGNGLLTRVQVLCALQTMYSSYADFTYGRNGLTRPEVVVKNALEQHFSTMLAAGDEDMSKAYKEAIQNELERVRALCR